MPGGLKRPFAGKTQTLPESYVVPRTLVASSSLGRVACHEHGTGVGGFLPGSWDHLGCQLWDHPARLVGGSWVRSFDRDVVVFGVVVEVGRGIQGGRRG